MSLTDRLNPPKPQAPPPPKQPTWLERAMGKDLTGRLVVER